ncbi:hypothetical protein K0B03_03345 [Patescibacteria group bacterium]|nr:hypothetical protein [Patescibacteria group bacterium]
MEKEKEVNKLKAEKPKTESDIKHHSIKKHKTKCCKSKDFNLGFFLGFLLTSAIIIILFNAVLSPFVKNHTGLTLEEAKTQTASLINDTFFEGNPEAAVSIKGGSEVNGLYKITVTTSQNQDVDVYLSKDGKLFIENVLDIEKVKAEKAAGTNGQEQLPQDIIKNEKPVVELFVMSHCPYGTQMEKGILPVIDTLGDKIDFELKFVDYAMHGEVEVNEQLNQYCIQKEENAKFNDYLKCFLEAGETDNCVKKTKINMTKLSSCISATDKTFKITEKLNDRSSWTTKYAPFDIHKAENTKYGVQGSPSLVINGAKVSSNRDPQSILDLICSGFEIAPEECNKQLPTVSASAGFGFDATGNATDASCG